jgi:hypothetical protein
MSTPSTPTSTSTPTSSSASQPGEEGAAPPAASLPHRVALIALMAVGSVAMWLGVPLGIVYLVSMMVDTTQPTMGPYVVVLFGLPIGMTVIGKCLGALDRHYGRVTGSEDERRQAAWLKSMRGERRGARPGRWKVLDVVMIWSVSIALTAFGVWFFLFAGSSLPGA